MNDSLAPIVPVILSGGSGTRLWPVSREHQPKQLHALVDERTMIHATIERASHLDAIEAPIVVTNAEHENAVRRALHDAAIADATLVLEPVGRNTAPAVAAAALLARRDGDDPLLLVLPADHVITDEAAFVAAIATARSAAADGYLVTFGITPTHAETGYGYIRSGDPIAGNIAEIAEFKEKPDKDTAQHYVDSGEYSWNSGMFLLRASRYLEELEAGRPEMAAAVERSLAYAGEGSTITLDAEAFGACSSESIDYAVMESTRRGAVLPVAAGWNDVGSWSSLWEIADRDDGGNAVSGDVVLVDVQHSYVRGSSRLVAVAGLEGVAVVDTPDAVLVTSLDAAQSVRDVATSLATQGRPEVSTDGTIIEPWGTSVVTATGPGHSIREVNVDPGASLPRRATSEVTTHLLVAEGGGRLTLADDTEMLDRGDSRMVPPGWSWMVEASATGLRMFEIAVDTRLHNSAPAPEGG